MATLYDKAQRKYYKEVYGAYYRRYMEPYSVLKSRVESAALPFMKQGDLDSAYEQIHHVCLELLQEHTRADMVELVQWDSLSTVAAVCGDFWAEIKFDLVVLGILSRMLASNGQDYLAQLPWKSKQSTLVYSIFWCLIETNGQSASATFKDIVDCQNAQTLNALSGNPLTSNVLEDWTTICTKNCKILYKTKENNEILSGRFELIGRLISSALLVDFKQPPWESLFSGRLSKDLHELFIGYLCRGTFDKLDLLIRDFGLAEGTDTCSMSIETGLLHWPRLVLDVMKSIAASHELSVELRSELVAIVKGLSQFSTV